jgi:uncharacterized membrane protein YkgB
MAATRAHRLTTTMSESPHLGNTRQPIAEALIRYGLVVVIMWIGVMKFTAYEAGGIQPLVAHSPCMSWVYGLFSVQAFSNLLGCVEIATGVMIALRLFSATVSAIWSLAEALQQRSVMPERG